MLESHRFAERLQLRQLEKSAAHFGQHMTRCEFKRQRSSEGCGDINRRPALLQVRRHGVAEWGKCRRFRHRGYEVVAGIHRTSDGRGAEFPRRKTVAVHWLGQFVRGVRKSNAYRTSDERVSERARCASWFGWHANLSEDVSRDALFRGCTAVAPLGYAHRQTGAA